MTVLADFQVIQSGSAGVGDTEGGGENPWVRLFDTGGRRADLKAFITLMVQGIAVVGASAEVEINETPVGTIFSNTSSGSFTDWFTQIIVFDGSVLRDINNRIVIRAIPELNHPSSGNLFLNFSVYSGDPLIALSLGGAKFRHTNRVVRFARILRG
jgi:hypothetical protein